MDFSYNRSILIDTSGDKLKKPFSNYSRNEEYNNPNIDNRDQ